MSTRRSLPRSFSRTVWVGLAALASVTLSGCSDAVDVEAPLVEGADLATCEALMADLPETFFGQERRETDPAGVTVAAWGDPAVVLTCGAPAPEEFDAFSRCSEIEGIGWFMPNRELKDVTQDITISAQSHSPRVSILVPAQWRTLAPDTELVAIAAPLMKHLNETKPCKDVDRTF